LRRGYVVTVNMIVIFNIMLKPKDI
jgi:hypothetical protein